MNAACQFFPPQPFSLVRQKESRAVSTNGSTGACTCLSLETKRSTCLRILGVTPIDKGQGSNRNQEQTSFGVRIHASPAYREGEDKHLAVSRISAADFIDKGKLLKAALSGYRFMSSRARKSKLYGFNGPSGGFEEVLLPARRWVSRKEVA